jgi:hypothetical protein
MDFSYDWFDQMGYLMLVPMQLFSPRQFSDELGGLVDQNREVLRANPIVPVLVFDCQQRNFLAALLTHKADMVIGCHGGLQKG